MQGNILEVNNLSVTFRTENETVQAVDGISFTVKKGCTTGIVGESGSGKSVTALAILKLLQTPPAGISAGRIILTGSTGDPLDLASFDSRQMRDIRGNRIAMIFQEPMTSLNPVIRCGNQITEAIRAHQPLSRKAAAIKASELFREVRLPDPAGIFRAYPHELSGGQKQRVMIAMAIASHPDILIADEPTTALDVTTQKSIIGLLKELQAKSGMAILFITHDLGLVSLIADNLLVMKEGKIVESGEAQKVLSGPVHPYTRQLLNSSRFINLRQFRHSPADQKEPLIQAENVKVYFPSGTSVFGRNEKIKAVDGVSFRVFPGEVLGLVGESGCGKTTLGRAVLRLVDPTEGTVRYRGQELSSTGKKELKKLRKLLQIIFQDPYSSLNPRLTVGNALTEPMRVHRIGKNRFDRRQKALLLLEKTGLDSKYFYRFPHELSGGQRQRVCIARALAVEPEFIICDESVSALDVSVRAQVLELLVNLKKEFGLTYIFISHDLSVVRFISDRIAVMKDGKIAESGTTEEIFGSPRSEYTKELLDAIPS